MKRKLKQKNKKFLDRPRSKALFFLAAATVGLAL